MEFKTNAILFWGEGGVGGWVDVIAIKISVNLMIYKFGPFSLSSIVFI